MGKPRLFTTLPVGMISDPRPTALDIRCAMAIALRDGMSLLKGKGGGCYAKLATLADDAGTDISNFSKSLSRLVDWGYVIREQQLMDKRRFTLRIAYPDPKQVGELTNKQDAEKVGEPASNTTEIVGEEANEPAEIVGDAEWQNRRISSETGRHYSSRREELHFDESKELNSSEEAHLGDAQCHSDWIEGAFDAASLGVNLRADRGQETPEGGLGRELVLAAHLPRNFANLPLGAQVARIDQAYTAIGRDPDRLDSRERDQLSEWLWAVFDEHMGGELDATAQQAARLREELHAW